MATTMLLGMLIMALAAWMYSIAASLMRLRAIILEREADAQWVRELDAAGAGAALPEEPAR
jgi:heme exporter protein C